MLFFILLYLALVLVRPQDYPILASPLEVPWLQVSLGLAGLAWLISPRKRFDAPQYPLLAGFLLTVLVSEIVPPARWLGGAVDALSWFGPTVLAFLFLANAAVTEHAVRRTMWAFAVCTGVLALHGVLMSFTGTGWSGVPMVEGDRIQYVGIFSDPNDLGLLFATVLPMVVYASGRGGWLGLRRVFWFAVAALIVWAIFLTRSRGALLAVAAMATVYVWRRRGLFLAAVFGSAGVFGITLLKSRLGDITSEDASAVGRLDAWYGGLLMFREYPFFGVGAGNFSEHNPLTAHNSFVLVLAETGIIGYTLWLMFVGYTFWMMITMVQHTPAVEGPEAAASWARWQAKALTLLLSLVAFFAAAFFLSRSYLVVLYLLAGLVVGCYTGARDEFPSLPRPNPMDMPLRWMAIVVGSIVGLWLITKVLL